MYASFFTLNDMPVNHLNIQSVVDSKIILHGVEHTGENKRRNKCT